MSLDSSLVERLGPLTDCIIRILSIEEINLLKAASISLDTVKTSHLNDEWCDFHQLIHARLILAGALPHVPKDKAEFYLFSHFKVLLP